MFHHQLRLGAHQLRQIELFIFIGLRACDRLNPWSQSAHRVQSVGQRFAYLNVVTILADQVGLPV